MSTFVLKYQENYTDFDYLEQIYKKVKLDELVKFNGKAYKRLRPINNKYMQNPSHFYLLKEDIYNGTVLINDFDDEFVTIVCHHKLVVERKK